MSRSVARGGARSGRSAAAALAFVGVVLPAAAEPTDGDGEAITRTQEIGGAAGLAIGGRTSPGGVELAGTYLYRLSDHDWLQSAASFTFGGGGPGCFRDRDDAVVCNHGVLDGFAAEASASLRRYFATQGSITPFGRLGLGLRLVSYGADDLRGVAFPIFLGGGVRAAVADDIHVTGSGDLRLGLGHFGRGVGGEPQLSLAILAGVEFALD
jgi:hypothetical protein